MHGLYAHKKFKKKTVTCPYIFHTLNVTTVMGQMYHRIACKIIFKIILLFKIG